MCAALCQSVCRRVRGWHTAVREPRRQGRKERSLDTPSKREGQGELVVGRGGKACGGCVLSGNAVERKHGPGALM